MGVKGKEEIRQPQLWCSLEAYEPVAADRNCLAAMKPLLRTLLNGEEGGVRQKVGATGGTSCGCRGDDPSVERNKEKRGGEHTVQCKW